MLGGKQIVSFDLIMMSYDFDYNEIRFFSWNLLAAFIVRIQGHCWWCSRYQRLDKCAVPLLFWSLLPFAHNSISNLQQLQYCRAWHVVWDFSSFSKFPGVRRLWNLLSLSFCWYWAVIALLRRLIQSSYYLDWTRSRMSSLS
jgi:hypothetical protein